MTNMLVINPYKLSRIYLSMTFLWVGAICAISIVLPLPGRVAGIPVGYFPTFILVSFFLFKLFARLKIDRSSLMFCLPFALFFFVATFSTMFQIVNPKNFVLYTSIYLFELMILLLNYKIPPESVEKLLRLYMRYALLLSAISLALFFAGITFKGGAYGANIFGALGVNRNSFTFTIFPACIFSIIFYLHQKTKLGYLQLWGFFNCQQFFV